MRVLQEMPKKTSDYYGNICGYCKECYKNLANTMDGYTGIARDAKKNLQLLWKYMRVLQGML